MDLNNIERNQLDYILTDVTPTEISEQFTYRYFYDYLTEKGHDIEVMMKKILDMKNNNNAVLFKDGNWISMPLKYTIMKELHSEREISLLQPLAAVELFLFISAYQKEMVTLLAKNSVFSLRFHRKNNDLYYKNKNKSVTKYFADLSSETGREIIEQTGMFFDIGPYKSIASFTSSAKWPLLNSKYKYFIRTDYKACFDSIYSHSFNWIIGKDVNDTKGFRNGSVYTSIDRVLMNINACTSNGIVVGPEFSRMVAELLLQTIDRDVFSMLLNQNYVAEENYNVFRFVDDLFIFAESEELASKIVELYSEAARKYLLRLNESKLYKSRVPFVLETWYSETNLASNRASSLLFFTKEEQKKYIKEFYESNDSQESFKPHLLKTDNLANNKKTIMNQFNVLICKYENKARTIVAYYLGMILNKVGKNKDKVQIFKDNSSTWAAFELIDLSLYIYSFFPNYNTTQRLLSIIGYINDEKSLFDEREKFQEKINRYAFVFDKANINDIINLILFCRQAKIEIPYKQELRIVNSLREKDDPILCINANLNVSHF